MDLSSTLEPKSDQLDAVDLASGSRIFTITKVTKGNAEQPANIHLAEFPRVWRPGKNMRRVLAGCWGKETDEWPPGAQVELYCDETVVFAGVAVGGIRISRVSHIDGRKKIPLILTKGKSVVWTVDPLPQRTTAQQVAELRQEWKTADPDRRKVIEAEVQTLSGKPAAATPEVTAEDAFADEPIGADS